MRDSITQGYERLRDRFVKWSRAEEGVRAAVIVGSRARIDDHPADEWSDLDVVMFVTDPEHCLSTNDWVEGIGNPWVTFTEPTPGGHGTERRVLFEAGLDVDFILLPVEMIRGMAETGIPSDAAGILQRGVDVLVDKDGLLEEVQIPTAESRSRKPPTQADFLQLVNDFWYHAVWTAKKLRRGELWTAKGCSDIYMKSRLLRMMEWHACATNGWDHDTWHGGRFLEEWASPRVVEDLHGTFAHYDENDIWRSLFATMDLFRTLAVETSEKLGLMYPAPADKHVTELVKNMFSNKD
jgi:aminoglycoside 6-adenylyltransferase